MNWSVGLILFYVDDRGLYTRDTAVCATPIGVRFSQSGATVPLWADAACTIFSSGTGAAVSNQSVDLIYFEYISTFGA